MKLPFINWLIPIIALSFFFMPQYAESSAPVSTLDQAQITVTFTGPLTQGPFSITNAVTNEGVSDPGFFTFSVVNNVSGNTGTASTDATWSFVNNNPSLDVTSLFINLAPATVQTRFTNAVSILFFNGGSINGVQFGIGGISVTYNFGNFHPTDQFVWRNNTNLVAVPELSTYLILGSLLGAASILCYRRKEAGVL